LVTGDDGRSIEPEPVQQIYHLASYAVAARLVPRECCPIENGDSGVRPRLQRRGRRRASRGPGAYDHDVIALGHVPTVRIAIESAIDWVQVRA